jgi:hypothetical protein
MKWHIKIKQCFYFFSFVCITYSHFSQSVIITSERAIRPQHSQWTTASFAEVPYITQIPKDLTVSGTITALGEVIAQNGLTVIGSINVEGGGGTIEGNLIGAASENVLKVGDTMTGDLILANGSAITLQQPTSEGVYGTSIQSPDALPSDITLTLPHNAPTAGYFLQTDDNGNLTWAVLSGSGTVDYGDPGKLALYSNNPLRNVIADHTTINAKTVTVVIAEPSATDRVYTIPDSGENSTFIMSEGNQSIDGDKTFSTIIVGNSALNVPGTIEFVEGSGTDHIIIQAPPSIAGNITLTLPSITPINGYFLQTDGSGNLTWNMLTGSGTVDYGTAGRVALYSNDPLQNVIAESTTLNSKTAAIAIAEPSTTNRIYTVPDSGVNSNFIMSTSASGQTIAGDITLSGTTTAITGNATITGTLTDAAMFNQAYGSAGTGEIRGLFIDSAGLIGAMASSSRRYKKNIEPIEHESEKILNLQPVSFVYKNDPAEKKQYGLIAEEAYEVYPEMVSLNSEGNPESVCIPRELTYMMLNEIQKNHRTIAALEVELATIKKILTKHDLL